MPAAARNRLLTLGGLVLVAFLMVFQPIRRVMPQQHKTIEDTFLIETKDALFGPNQDRAAAADALRHDIDLEPTRRGFEAKFKANPLTLTPKDPLYKDWETYQKEGKDEKNWVDKVTFEGSQRARIVTVPLTERQSQQYLEDILTVMRRKYPDAHRLYESEAWFDLQDSLFGTAPEREKAMSNVETLLRKAGPQDVDWLTRVTFIDPKRIRINVAGPSRRALSGYTSTALHALQDAHRGVVEIQPPVPQTVLTFEFPTPVAPTGDEQERLREEVRSVLLNANPSEADWLGPTLFETAMRLRIRTKATTYEQADRYREIIRQALEARWPDIREIAETVQRHKEVPLAKLWIFELYKPVPHINLGLDLRGGSHLVLQCLPETTYTFSTPRSRPMLAPGQTLRDLENQLLDYLDANRAEYGVGYTVKAVDPNRVEISLRTRTKVDAETRGKFLEAYLGSQHGASLDGRDELLLADDTARKVKDIIERRINYLGVAESTIEIRGKDRLIVEIPESEKADELKGLLNTPALLEFLLLPEGVEAEYSSDGKIRGFHDKETGAPLTNDQVVAMAREALNKLPPAEKARRTFLGRDLNPDCQVVPDDKAPGAWAVTFDLKTSRKEDFNTFTRANVGHQLAILLDGRIEMAPVIETALPGGGRITGRFTLDQAKALKLLLNAGALPVPIQVVEDRTVSATLGKDSIDKSVKAAMLGVVLVIAFMVMYYRAPGFLADIALCVYVLLVLSVYTFIGATLTLPGIAAFILSIGMAVDANVIIFERMKEELHSGRTLKAAMDVGFSRAWTAILDGHVTTLIVAVVLYYLGTSFIRGFAVTLFIGVCCNLFSAIVVTRWLMGAIIASKLATRRSLFHVGLSRA